MGNEGNLAVTLDSGRELIDEGLFGGTGIAGSLQYERPAYIYGHRLKDCTAGAFTYFNAAGQTSAYRVHFGRYSQIGEGSVLGPPEHPMDWFSSHPFAFTRPKYMPNIYQLEDFARLGPDEKAGPSYVDTVPHETFIGHEAYIGAGSFVKRGVRIGDGAVVGACSVVTKDVPPYAIVAGSPARIVRMRFSESIVERLLKLQWWRYDLAPFKNAVDFQQVEATLAFFEEQLACGALQPLQPPAYRVVRRQGMLIAERLSRPLHFAAAAKV
ncbi:CatB-related O-acetyltransferase [Solimonas soli]|uniref:CatB-related O-acetyltransferase n=1 Tax=Solimonas soli TaxID=413479 RepID=UPI0004B9679A|nr:CatB-related O-acetyltransferase [Solimonas soli]